MEQRVMRMVLVALILGNVMLAGLVVFVRVLWNEEQGGVAPPQPASPSAAPVKTVLPAGSERGGRRSYAAGGGEAPQSLEDLRLETLGLLRERIDVLKGESTRESLDQLIQPLMFDFTVPFFDVYPNSVAYEMPPVSDQAARQDFVRILCNRRVAKLIAELGALPKSEAAELLSAHLEKRFSAYCDEMENEGGKNASHIEILRLTIGALVLIAGNLELTETSGPIRAIAELAVEQRDQAYGEAAHGVLEMIGTYETFVSESLYNRPVLATGLVGVGIGGAVLQASSYSWETLELAPYDSLVSPADPPGLRGDLVPDYSRGRIEVRHLAGLVDSELDRILGRETAAR